MRQSQATTALRQVVEFPGLPPTCDREMLFGWSKILADGRDRHTHGGHVGEDLFYLVGRLAQADH